MVTGVVSEVEKAKVATAVATEVEKAKVATAVATEVEKAKVAMGVAMEVEKGVGKGAVGWVHCPCRPHSHSPVQNTRGRWHTTLPPVFPLRFCTTRRRLH